MLSYTSYSELQYFLNAADIGVLLRHNHIMNNIVTSGKIRDYMACGLPILVGIDGEAKALIENSKTGYYYEPENGHDLAKKIKILLHDNTRRNQFSKNAIHYVKEHFKRNELTNKLEKAIFQEKT